MRNFGSNRIVSYYSFDLKPIQSFKIFEYLFKCNIYKYRKGLCLRDKMWLPAVLLLTTVLTLLEVFILGHHGPSRTGRIQQLPFNTNHKQGATNCWNYLLLL